MRSVLKVGGSRTPTGGPRRAARHRRRRLRWPWRVGVAVLAVASLVAADFVVYRGRVHPGVEIGRVAVGGLSLDDAARLLEAEAERLLDRPIRFRGPGETFSTSPRSLGWRPDPRATAAAAYRVGRSGPLWSDASTRAAALVRPVGVPWRATWDRADLSRSTEHWSEVAGEPPREGRVRVRGTRVTAIDPVPGRQVDAEAVASMVSAVVHGRRTIPLPLPMVRADPITTSDDVSRAEEEIRELISAPVTARLGPVEIEISPSDLGDVIRTAVDPGEGLRVELAPGRVADLLAPHRAEVETRPRPARFVVRGNRVRIRSSAPGSVLSGRLAARDLLAIARSPDRAGRIRLAPDPPSFTTEDARALDIRREVAAFTTHYAAGEPRVRNIHRAADILDGAIIESGARFSLNRRLGNRTADRGFVSAPVIYDGEFTTDIGGGVSQLATTVFNAAFFAGYPILEHQAHSFYISRYPMGREATVSWPKPDLVFRNDTRTGALIKTEYTASSITVRIFGRRYGRRVTATDPVITGRGDGGFSVRVERIVERRDEEVRRDTFTTFYRE